MKAIKIVVLSILVFTFSCSKSSDDEDKNEENSIIGVWVFEDTIPLETGSDEDVSFSQAFNNIIPLVNCDLISFEIRADKSLVLRGFDDLNGPGPDPNNPVYECSGFVSGTGTWTFIDNVLKISDSEGDILLLNISFKSSGVFHISGDDSGADLGEILGPAKEYIFRKLSEA